MMRGRGRVGGRGRGGSEGMEAKNGVANSKLLSQNKTAVTNDDRLVGLVVKASSSRAEDPGFESRLRRDFFPGLSHTSD